MGLVRLKSWKFEQSCSVPIDQVNHRKVREHAIVRSVVLEMVLPNDFSCLRFHAPEKAIRDRKILVVCCMLSTSLFNGFLAVKCIVRPVIVANLIFPMLVPSNIYLLLDNGVNERTTLLDMNLFPF